VPSRAEVCSVWGEPTLVKRRALDRHDCSFFQPMTTQQVNRLLTVEVRSGVAVLMAAIAGKRAIPTKNEPKCKLCRHPERERIDQLLFARSERQQDPASGQNINLEYVLSALTGLGVENPTEENCKTHWRKHVEVVDAGAADEMDAVVTEMYAELIAAAPVDDDPVSNSRWQMKLWRARELARLRSGEGPSVTTDQAQTAARILVTARSNDAQEKLLGGLAGAIGGAMGAIGGARKALPTVIEGEVVEADDGD
jgi:hypothetical protein